MKANRKFVTEEEAVSPVIAVILMVAITVVLAATVFVLVSDIGGQQSAAPAINFATDETQDRLVVNSADSRADWSRLQVSAAATTGPVIMGNVADCDASGASCVSKPAAAASNSLATGSHGVTASADQMGAGEYIEFCDGGAESEQVTITVVDVQANSKIGDYVFSDLAGC